MEAPGRPAFEQTLVHKLVAVKPEAVTLEITTTTVIDGRTLEGGTTSSTLPAKVERGREYLSISPDFRLEFVDVKEGKETLEVNGQKVETATREYTANTLTAQGGRPNPNSRLAMSIKARLWMSPDVPGGLVKKEEAQSQGGRPGSTTTLTLVSYTAEK
jgi:hypothetical protein